MAEYITPKAQGSLFDGMTKLDELKRLGDPLARLDAVTDWGVLAPILARLPKAEPKGPGGRPAYHPAMMLKVIVLQHLYGLSDHQAQFQITDRASFKQFLGLSDADKAPDEKTIWAFRESLTRAGLFEALFTAFTEALDSKGMIARKGQIIDATFVEVPRQRNTRKENEQILAGEPCGWEEQPAKARQKDKDARWTRKHDERHFGYKNHIKTDSESKLITAFVVSDAAVHDSQVIDLLVEEGDPITYADSAYAGAPTREAMERKGIEFAPIERAWRNRELTEEQKASNREKSRTRARVEHVFGTMCMCMRALWHRCIGMVRNSAMTALTNLVYNMVRAEQIHRLGLGPLHTS